MSVKFQQVKEKLFNIKFMDIFWTLPVFLLVEVITLKG